MSIGKKHVDSAAMAIQVEAGGRTGTIPVKRVGKGAILRMRPDVKIEAGNRNSLGHKQRGRQMRDQREDSRRNGDTP